MDYTDQALVDYAVVDSWTLHDIESGLKVDGHGFSTSMATARSIIKPEPPVPIPSRYTARNRVAQLRAVRERLCKSVTTIDGTFADNRRVIPDSSKLTGG